MPPSLDAQNAQMFATIFSSPLFIIGFVLFLAWMYVWKGLAWWHSARRGNKVWFIVFMFINTMGILEIIYLAFVAKIWSKAADASGAVGGAG